MNPSWHAISPAEALQRLNSSPAGLDEEEAARRLAQFGPNVFRATKPISAWPVLLAQVRSVIVLLLTAAVVVALLSGESLDAAAIGIVLLLNIAIGFATELRAHRAMEALLSLEVTRARLIRKGQLREIEASALVPGHVIELEAGQAVSADARLLEAVELRTVAARGGGGSAQRPAGCK